MENRVIKRIRIENSTKFEVPDLIFPFNHVLQTSFFIFGIKVL